MDIIELSPKIINLISQIDQKAKLQINEILSVVIAQTNSNDEYKLSDDKTKLLKVQKVENKDGL